MVRYVYEYEDHTYPTQAKARNVLGDAICLPGQHRWRELAPGASDVCTKCGIIRWMEGIPLKCYHEGCGREWTYGGKGKIYATCPSCLRKVRIDRARKDLSK